MVRIRNKLNINLDINKYFKYVTNGEVLFFDIETTGFSRKKSSVYLIGYIFFENNYWIFEQILIEKSDEERILITDFYDKINKYNTLIHYNGSSFDVPYMRSKCDTYSFEIAIFDYINNIDLYKNIKCYKKIFKLDNYKLKSIEKFLKIQRKDNYTGGELIEQFYEFLKTKNKMLKQNLLLHNKEDIINLVELLKKSTAIINYFNNLYNRFKISNIIYNLDCVDIEIISEHPAPINFDFNQHNNFNLFVNKGSYKCKLCVPIIVDTLRYFYNNYKDYYYIPEKDEVVHKSIAQYFTLKKVKVKASNCYIKKRGSFIPLLMPIKSIHLFRKEYKDKNQYILIEDLQNKNQIHDYISSLLVTLKS